MLISKAFIPLVFSMRLDGPGADDEGRTFVFENDIEGRGGVFPPDLFVISPEREILGRLRYDATAEQTIELLREVLESRPDLAPPPDQLHDLDYDLTAPMQAELAALESRWEGGERGELVEPVESWINKYGDSWEHGAATAHLMLGNALYHRGDFDGADDAWRIVKERYADHPLKHRAMHHMLDAVSWHMPHHPDIGDATHPSPGAKKVVDPNPTLRLQNEEMVANDHRYRVGASGLPLVEIPSGTFTMGGQPAMFERELPLREVTITRPFLAAAWPVTIGMWLRFRPDAFPTPADSRALKIPMTRITREDALEYCEFLSELDGLQYRMPTEAEWEYASRGGLEGLEYPWGNEVPDRTMCNYDVTQGVPVASYPANGFHLFDMVGNCSEWVSDRFLDEAYSLTPLQVIDPRGPTEEDGWTLKPGGSYVIRGGYLGITFSKFLCRNAHRISLDKAGLRPVADPL